MLDTILEYLAMVPWWAYIIAFLLIVAIRDRFFAKKHSIVRNFPIIGHFRYWLEALGPELRQYIVANNREELPFNREQRSWIYASAKKENNYRGFGTDMNQFSANFIFIKPAMFPYQPPANHPNKKDPYYLPSAKIMGEHNRKRPYRPQSIANISAMSYGSLSKNAISALNKGAKKAGCFHNTGEGGLSPYHSFGADVMFQFGTGYFGIRDEQGNFSMLALKELTQKNPFIRGIEVKLSQGAKPGKGGVLPAAKITYEIAKIRMVQRGKSVISPPIHSAFNGVQGMVDFIEEIAEETGLPVGIKSAVGQMGDWHKLADIMQKTGKGPDYIAIDGGEGGTGAAPIAFADHVALPFVYAFAEVYKIFKERGLTDKVTFIAAGKLGLPAYAAKAFAMGADMVYVAREAMLSIGCIQAKECHTNHCPSGVATQNKWLQRGLDVDSKSERFYNYMKALRKEVLEVTHAAGYEHPCQLTMDDVNISMGDNNFTQSLAEAYKYDKEPVKFEGMENLKV